ncbi:MAG: Clp1/GlmU family protein [Gammaproteobacteria bacterium]
MIDALVDVRTLLVCGEPGVGKSTVAEHLAQRWHERGFECWCFDADPGSPRLGVPGAVSLMKRTELGWQRESLEGLCSLDPSRFRLPLIAAAQRLIEREKHESGRRLIVNMPGLTRGVGAAELLEGMSAAASVDKVLVLARDPHNPPFAAELRSLKAAYVVWPAEPAAHSATKIERARRRTALWKSYLRDAQPATVALGDIPVVGTPPPHEALAAWRGRQIAALDRDRNTVAFGEIARKTAMTLHVSWVRERACEPVSVLVRDAVRDAGGSLTTARPIGAIEYADRPFSQLSTTREARSRVAAPRPSINVGPAYATLVNGVFGDPLVHVRIKHQPRGLLFDLGAAGQLPACVMHQITDVFVSHCHLDHICGLLWLLRARVGEFPPCRLYGPVGLAHHVQGFLEGVLWDRVGERGPRFDVIELRPSGLAFYELQAAANLSQRPLQVAEERPSIEGLLVEEPWFRVRAVELDHGTPVLAFRMECAQQINIRKELLEERDWPPGTWLTRLKRCLHAGDLHARIELPNGQTASANELGQELAVFAPGPVLAYATDLADTRENRARLVSLAHGADTFFCEASFVHKDADKARGTGHLTATACGEIAAAARVRRLVPFHFSRRYELSPERVYQEVQCALQGSEVRIVEFVGELANARRV